MWLRFSVKRTKSIIVTVTVVKVQRAMKVTKKLAMNFAKGANDKKIMKVIANESARVVEKRRVADMTGVESVKVVRREIAREMSREGNEIVNVKGEEW